MPSGICLARSRFGLRFYIIAASGLFDFLEHVREEADFISTIAESTLLSLLT